MSLTPLPEPTPTAPTTFFAADFGTLAVASQAPLFIPRLRLLPGRLVNLPPGTAALQLGWTHVNIWAQMPGYFFDGEWSEWALRLNYALPHANHWELAAYTALYRRSGGFLDGLISGFHDSLGITQARRHLYPRNRLLVQTLDNAASQTRLQTSGVGWGNPTVGVRRQFTYPGGAPRHPLQAVFMVEGWLKLPLGSVQRAFATPNIALLYNMGVQLPLHRRWTLYTQTGIIFSPGEQVLWGMTLNPLQKYLLLGIGFNLNHTTRLVLHYLNQDGAAEQARYAPLNKTTHEFVLGVQWQLAHAYAPTSPAWLLEAGIIENSIHDANTPDFGFHVGLRHHLALR